MILYHMSDSLKLGEELTPDYLQHEALIEPFFRALERSEDCFYAMLLNARYFGTVLRRHNIWDWTNYPKWATEAAFEFVRQTQFPNCTSRIFCNYYYDDLGFCQNLFEYDWGKATDEARARVHLYEVELDADAVERRDMRIYDEGYDAMRERHDIKTTLDCARRYFAGEQTAEPVWEFLSDKPARATKDVTEYLSK